MPATLDWLNNNVLEDWHGICHLSTQGLRYGFWTVPPAYDHWYLDGHFPLVVLQHRVNRCWLRGNAGRSLPHKSNGMVSEHTAWGYAQSERH